MALSGYLRISAAVRKVDCSNYPKEMTRSQGAHGTAVTVPIRSARNDRTRLHLTPRSLTPTRLTERMSTMLPSPVSVGRTRRTISSLKAEKGAGLGGFEPSFFGSAHSPRPSRAPRQPFGFGNHRRHRLVNAHRSDVAIFLLVNARPSAAAESCPSYRDRRHAGNIVINYRRRKRQAFEKLADRRGRSKRREWLAPTSAATMRKVPIQPA